MRIYQAFSRAWQRNRQFRRVIFISSLLAVAVVLVATTFTAQPIPPISLIPNGVFFPNPNGASQTYSTNSGGIDETGPFFQNLGTNGRACATCHQPSDGMSVSAANVETRFLLTQGQDPIFRPVDGSNCNHNIDV